MHNIDDQTHLCMLLSINKLKNKEQDVAIVGNNS